MNEDNEKIEKKNNKNGIPLSDKQTKENKIIFATKSLQTFCLS